MKELARKIGRLEKGKCDVEVSLREQAEKKLRKLENKVSKLPVTIGAFTYIQLYQTLQQMFFQEDYSTVIDICDVVCSRK